MINRIIVSFFLVELLVALSIYLIWVANGVTPHVVQLGGPFLAFMQNCSKELKDFEIAIPFIPSIPSMDSLEGFSLILNAFITFVNNLTSVLNFVITIFNTVIQLIEFIFIILKNLMSLRDTISGVPA